MRLVGDHLTRHIQNILTAAETAGTAIVILLDTGDDYTVATPPGQDPTLTAGMVHTTSAQMRCRRPDCRWCRPAA